jgi:hypothetical protein
MRTLPYRRLHNVLDLHFKRLITAEYNGGGDKVVEEVSTDTGGTFKTLFDILVVNQINLYLA